MQLSALGIAVASAVALAEILKARGLAHERKLRTELEDVGADRR